MNKVRSNLLRTTHNYRLSKRSAKNYNDIDFACYLAGVWETDGDAKITVSKDQDRPQISIANRDSAYLVALGDEMKSRWGIVTRLTEDVKIRTGPLSLINESSDARGSRLYIESWIWAEKFVEILKQGLNSQLGLCGAGPKSKELLAIEILCDRKKYSKTIEAKKLTVDLKEEWHTLSGRPRDPNQLPRSTYESRKNLPPGSSVGAASDLIKTVNETYAIQEKLQKKWAKNKISQKEKGKLSNYKSSYITGMFEGDGCFLLPLYRRTDHRTGTKSLDFQIGFRLTGSNLDLQSHEVVECALELKAENRKIEPTSVESTYGLKENVQKIRDFLVQKPFLHRKSIIRFAALDFCYRTFKGGALQTPSKRNRYTKFDQLRLVKYFYAAPTSHGKKRDVSEVEMLQWVEDLYK